MLIIRSAHWLSENTCGWCNENKGRRTLTFGEQIGENGDGAKIRKTESCQLDTAAHEES